MKIFFFFLALFTQCTTHENRTTTPTLFSSTPGYTCLALNGEQAIDIEHDNRGHGLAKFTLTEEGEKVFQLLMTIADLKQESACFQILLKGGAAQKIAALDWLETHHAWNAKRWIQGMLYDASLEVRVRAARYISNTQYLHFLPNLRSVYQSETDKEVKA